MIEWFNLVVIAVAVLAGLLCLVLGFVGKHPNDVTLGATALVELLMIATFVIALVAPAFGNAPTGDPLEFWVYLISALLVPPAAAVWALVDRSKWSNVVLGVAALAIAIMVYRMDQIWFVQGV